MPLISEVKIILMEMMGYLVFQVRGKRFKNNFGSDSSSIKM